MRSFILMFVSVLLTYTNLNASSPVLQSALIGTGTFTDKSLVSVKADKRLKTFTSTLLNDIIYQSMANRAMEGHYQVEVECTIDAKGKAVAVKIRQEPNEQVKMLVIKALQNYQFDASKADGVKTKTWKHVFSFIVL